MTSLISDRRPIAADPKGDAAESHAADGRCFTIEIEGQSFGLPVASIQTVFEVAAITPVPLASATILGLVNLRGKIVTAISLRRRLKGNVVVDEPSRLAVGLDYKGENYAVLVDSVGDVISLAADSAIDTPPHLGSEGLKFSGVHKLDTMILPVLDLAWVFSFERAA